MKLAYVHNLPLEYYPPASNMLNLLGALRSVNTRVFTTHNLMNREVFNCGSVNIDRTSPPDPAAWPVWRLLVALWWHVKTAVSLGWFRPDSIIYIEPHSAIAVWIYYTVFRGKARLFIHHHEYYEPQDFYRPGMRLPRLCSWLEHRSLFGHAEWISQTNEDRLRLVKGDFPGVPETVWRVLPNYPPEAWCSPSVKDRRSARIPLRLIYVGAASFEDTYVKEIVEWAAAYPESIKLHICGYNVVPDVWEWLDKKQFDNVSFDPGGYKYGELPGILSAFDVGLVLYKGNTTNFVYNVPNKVFEYLVCGLEVWYPNEMLSIRKFQQNSSAPLRELRFTALEELRPETLHLSDVDKNTCSQFTAERAFAPLIDALGVAERSVDQ